MPKCKNCNVLCDRGGTVVEKRGGGMTENIAIYCLKAASELNTEMCEECPLYGQTGADHCCEDALQVAIKALEELQQYRAIGTPEECQKSVAVCKAMIARKITPENMEEYMKFEDECVKNGFTFDSLLKAREKQTAKKVKSISQVKDGDSYVGLIGRCPCCGDILEEGTVWCDCGQKLDWNTDTVADQ